MIKPKRCVLPRHLRGGDLFCARPKIERSQFAIAHTWRCRADVRYRVMRRQVLWGTAESNYPPRWYAEVHCQCANGTFLWCAITGCPSRGFAGASPAFAAVKKAIETDRENVKARKKGR